MPRRPLGLAALAAAASLVALAPAWASSPQLATVVSPTPVSWTPNVSASTTVGQEGVCNTQWFGTALPCVSEVYGTAAVNGDVVVVGAFTEACKPGTFAQGLCSPGTQVTRDDIFAYQAGTGVIDPHFVPILNQGPAFTVIPGPAGTNTVYVGGTFTSVNGATHKGLVQLNVNPGVTSGTTADGSVVAGFKAGVSDYVHNLALSPDGKALYAGGQFSTADSTAETGLARFNSVTGALDTSFHVTLSDPVLHKGSPLPIKVEAMNQAANGTLLAIGGTALMVNGQSRPRLAIINTGGTLGHAATLTDFTAPILTNNCTAENDYVRSISFAPDGSSLFIGTNGFTSDGSTPFSVCDAAARFNTIGALTTTGTPVAVSPAWINYTGGDSIYTSTDAGTVVYSGGHNRWINNFCGKDAVCEQNALLDDGLSAYDANTGMGIAWWHPETLRGAGAMYINTFGPGSYLGPTSTRDGLVLGTDVDEIGGQFHSENAIFPQGPTTTTLPFGPIPSGLFNEEGGSNTSHPLCVQDDTAHGNAVDLAVCLYNSAQNWTAPAPGTAGHVTINGLCLDTSGTLAVLNACSTATSQQWQQGAGNTVVQQGSGQCLTDPGSNPNPGTVLGIASCASGNQGQVFPLPVAPGPAGGAAALPTGSVFPQVVQKNTQVPCLDDKGGAVTPGSPVVVWTCLGDANQSWTVQPDGTIRHMGNCLDTSGTLVVLNPCGTTPPTSQIWTPAGLSANNELVQKSSGLCLTIPADNTANGTQLDVEACNSSLAYQAWRLPTI